MGGGDAFDGRCFHPVGDQSNDRFEVPMIRELLALVKAQVKTLNSEGILGLVKMVAVCCSGLTPSLSCMSLRTASPKFRLVLRICLYSYAKRFHSG